MVSELRRGQQLPLRHQHNHRRLLQSNYRVLSVLCISNLLPQDAGIISCMVAIPNANVTSQTNHTVLCKYGLNELIRGEGVLGRSRMKIRI